jgi:Xaa-Pro aminopeptidase
MTSEGGLDVASVRRRQQRLCEQMQALGLDLVIVQQIEHVQWLCGPRYPWTMTPLAALRADGHVTLVAPKKPVLEAVADEVVTYEAQWLSTLRNDQRQAASQQLLRVLGPSGTPRRVGVEFSCCTSHLAVLSGEWVDIEPTLFRLRRRKEPDELACLRRAIAATGHMYALARQIIEPGIPELEVFNRLQAAAVEACGEMLTATGNDYQCGARGGPPRAGRRASAGELYILDLGPAYRGYFADNCRTLAVDRRPTDVQLAAWSHLVEVLKYVEQTVRPGVQCRALFHEVQQRLAEAPVGIFNHHLGHGIGLFPHEAPHLNPHWDETFEVGDVFTCEPGLYDEQALRAGIRLENDYLVTEDGVENLSPFPLEL